MCTYIVIYVCVSDVPLFGQLGMVIVIGWFDFYVWVCQFRLLLEHAHIYDLCGMQNLYINMSESLSNYIAL